MTDLVAEGASADLKVHSQALITRGTCWSDAPQASTTQLRAGFDWLSSPAGSGIHFKSPEGCFRLTLRVGGKQTLPRVAIGAADTTPNAGPHQDTIELCR